jgi:RecJ-like exonuclease
MNIGEVRQCAHCEGTGKCVCVSCSKAAGIDHNRYDVKCTACNGKGSVWIGPEIVQLPPDKS